MTRFLLPVFTLVTACPGPTAVDEGSPNLPPPAASDDAPPPSDAQPATEDGPSPDGADPDKAIATTTPEGGSVDQVIPDSAMRLDTPGFTVEPGQGVKISGTLSYSGTKEGVYRIDFLTDSAPNTLPHLLHSVSLDQAGAWEVEAPKDLGKVTLVAFLDENGNGPSLGEPFMEGRQLQVGSTPITDVAITLSEKLKKPDDEPDDAPPFKNTEPQGPPVAAGEGVLLSGTVRYDGEAGGQIQIDVIGQASAPDQQLTLLYHLTLDEPGPFQLEVPPNLGDVNIFTFIDIDQDGPQPSDPQGKVSSLHVGDKPISDIDIELSEDQLVAPQPPSEAPGTP